MSKSIIIPIDRSKPLNPVRFVGKGWAIEEEDVRSLTLHEIDIAKIQLVTMLKPGEQVLDGEERLRRLKESGYIRLDAKILQTLWESRYLLGHWKEKVDGKTLHIFCDGTIFRHPRDDGHNRRCVQAMYWLEGMWMLRSFSLDSIWSANSPSAVLIA